MSAKKTKPLLGHAIHYLLYHLKLLTEYLSKESWSGAGRQVDAQEVDWCARQRHSNSYQRVDSVTVERHHHQENAAHAVNYRKEQR